MTFRNLLNGFWKISASRREHLERWIEKNGFKKRHLKIEHKLGGHNVGTFKIGK